MTEDRERLGERVLALAALWLLFSGILMALSFVVLALVSLALLLVVVGALGARWLDRRYELSHGFARSVTVVAGAGERAAGRARSLGGRRHLRPLGRRLRTAATGIPGRADAALTAALRRYALTVYRLRARTARLLPADERVGHRRAVRLNELGAELRRRGAHEQAAEQHREALDIVRDLGDEQAEALTLNSLALALAQSGAETEAIQYLEHARGVLHELGDEKHEARVIANLGIVYRRQGLSEEAAILLHEALDKLPPESPAYRRVQEELRRAS